MTKHAFGTCYQNASRALVLAAHPSWNVDQVEAAASREWEAAATNWLVQTIRTCVGIRPQARWGYYGLPKRGHDGGQANRPPWSDYAEKQLPIFEASRALYPSIYLHVEDTPEENEQMVRNLLNETLTLASHVERVTGRRPPVLPYAWEFYGDRGCCALLSDADLETSLALPKELGAQGVVIWGSLHMANATVQQEYWRYFKEKTGPLVMRIHGGKTDDSHAEPQPSRPSGVAVLGTPKWLPTKAEPYEKYLQVQLEWQEVEATRGAYDFSLLAAQLQRLDEAERSDPGLRAIVKLQTNSKPQWVYDVVPSTSQVWSAENWDNRTAMYWHPTYIELYLALVAAFARYTQTDPLASKYIDFTRQSWCAIGEEGIGIPGTPAAVVALRNGSAWDVPAGCTESCHPPPNWSADGDVVYQRRVLQRYNESYGQSALTTTAPRLLVRTNTPTDLIADYRAQFVQGRYGWFHTGAGMYETQCFNQSQRYDNFRRDCLPLDSTTVCFAEMCGVGKLIPTAKQRHGVVYSDAEVSYWIALSNMDSGVSISGMHAASVLSPQARTPELTARLSWAAGYMGRHASLQSAPGAWAAFRAEDDAGPDSDAPGRRDFTFLMAIKSVVSAPVERQCGDSGAGFGAWCRIIRGSGAIHLASTDGMFGSSVTLRLVYLPSTASAGAGCVLQLWYVSAATHSGELGLSVPTFATTPRWAEATANVSDAAFGGKGPHGSDVWLVLAGGNSCEARVHMVEVRKPQE